MPRNRRCVRRLAPPTAFGLVLVLAGCSGSGDRLAVSGTVTFKGQALDQGSIQFIPTGSDGEPGGGVITDGKYSIPREQGLKPGKYRIVISSGQPNPKAGPAAPGEAREAGPPVRERIPPEYNQSSEQKPVIREVNPGNTRIDFDIK